MNSFLLLTDAAAAGSSTAGLVMTIGYIVIIVAFFYFVIMRPQKKQEKEHAATLSNLEIGDSVLTTAGFYGIVIDIDDEVVIVEFGSNKNCRIPMQKKAIIEVEKPGE